MLRAKARRMLLAARALSRRTAAAVCRSRPVLLSPSRLAAQRRFVEAEGERVCERPITKNDVLVVKLHQAVREGHLHLVEDVLQQYQPGTAAAVSSLNENGDACIHVAAKLGHAEIASLLLHHGADKDSLGSRSRTPLHLASLFGHQAVVDALLASGADVSISQADENGYEHVRQALCFYGPCIHALLFPSHICFAIVPSLKSRPQLITPE